MAYYFNEPSRTFSEYLIVPGYSSAECTPANVSLKTPLVKFRKGKEEPELSLNIPMVSAIMQSVSGEKMACALAREGGISFIYGSQTIENEAAMVRRVKATKAGFVYSDSNIRPDATLQDVLDLKEETGHATMAVTEDGTPEGKLLGIITSRDYRTSRMDPSTKVADFMTPFEKLIYAEEGVSLKEANDIIWDHKLNALPIIGKDRRLKSFVFRKDYDAHKENPNELLDSHKRYIVGAGINTRDYAERVPALLEAGVDVLCVDSSEGFSEFQRQTIRYVKETFGEDTKIGGGNVVDREGFRFLAEAGADFVKIGIGGGSVMSAAKAMWLLYENPEMDLEAVAAKYNTLAASDNDFPATGRKAKLALMATTAATGAECSPFAVLKNDKGEKCVIANYNLIPEMAVIRFRIL